MSGKTESSALLPKVRKPRSTSCWKLAAAWGGTILAVPIALFAVFFGTLHLSSDAVNAFDAFLDRMQGAKEYNAANQFLNGNFAPVSDEVSQLPVEVISGKIPKGLSGTFIRIGPNPIAEHGFSKRYHWFDGHGYIHTLKLDPNTNSASYSSAWVKNNRYTYEKAVKRDYFFGVGEFIGFIGLLKALLVIPLKVANSGIEELRDGQSNTALVFHANRLFALHEQSLPFEIRLKEDGTFESIGFEDFGKLDFPMSAHPKVDLATGELLFHGYKPAVSTPYKWGTITPNGTLSNYVPYSTPDNSNSISHDFAFTKDHAIILDSSVRFNPEKLMEGKVFFFDESYPMRFGLAPRKSNNPEDTTWFQIDQPMVIMHTLNAWESGDKTILWSPCAQAFDLVDIAGEKSLFSMCVFKFDRATKKAEVKIIDTPYNGKRSFEFPRVHDKFAGIFAKYGFSGMSTKPDGRFNSIAKWEINEDGSNCELKAVINFEERQWGGEPVFVPDPNPTKMESDQGWLMTYVFDEITKETTLKVFDAVSMKETPTVALKVPRVPYGFHGAFVGQNQMNDHAKYWQQRVQRVAATRSS
mmetsp:Transcript_24970/g.34723  ORF Transcript_24970/g.34723 Transcript_24970/m.34723 type:complete len:582 (-) Transcript_24970:337-2082(-)|eukprot:CAMPEP_0184488800 /NCGR_PEP_ID=MMETSP0113_2-20130426/13490_1 /TAXON_ID=91329 /ORGANISM="Norrisiella sphaerica, Strain BC52" /LENGTH=581 /DNA_ID=CAMNT_0026871837 /DNA_START=52 /DNA_END=1797 /DNA_ORIENTATION=-